MQRTGTIFEKKISKRAISLVKIHPVVKEEMSFEAIVDDACRVITIAHIEPLVELKYN